MSDFAAHLVDRVIPRCPVRQWVLTAPYSLRARMMFDPALTTVVLRELIAAVSAWLRRRARRLGIKGVLKTGAVTVIQRFNSALGASPHFHTLFIDGVYSFTLGRAPVFHPTLGPTDEDVALVAASVSRRVTRKLAGGEPSPAHQDFIDAAPLLAAISQAAVGGASATGSRRGQRVVRVRGAPAAVDAVVLGRLRVIALLLFEEPASRGCEPNAAEVAVGGRPIAIDGKLGAAKPAGNFAGDLA